MFQVIEAITYSGTETSSVKYYWQFFVCFAFEFVFRIKAIFFFFFNQTSVFESSRAVVSDPEVGPLQPVKSCLGWGWALHFRKALQWESWSPVSRVVEESEAPSRVCLAWSLWNSERGMHTLLSIVITKRSIAWAYTGHTRAQFNQLTGTPWSIFRAHQGSGASL